jgi:hypothetical protein
LELVAAASVVAYLVLGLAAKRFIPVGVWVDDDLFDTDAADITNDELISVFVWVGTTLVAAIAMAVLGSRLQAVVLAALIVAVGGGVAYAYLHYGVWGAHLLSMANAPWIGWVWGWFILLGLPAALSTSLLILTTRAVAGLEDAVVIRILVTIGTVLILLAIIAAVRSRRERRDWLRAADAAANADPEVAEALRAAGWRTDGPVEEMASIWWGTVSKVNRARVLANLPIFEGPTPPT